MSRIDAPFTPEEVKYLAEWQKNGSVHPFTCCSHNGCQREKHNDGVLKPTPQGWVCPCGKYTQTWAHDFMAKPIEQGL